MDSNDYIYLWILLWSLYFLRHRKSSFPFLFWRLSPLKDERYAPWKSVFGGSQLVDDIKKGAIRNYYLRGTNSCCQYNLENEGEKQVEELAKNILIVECAKEDKAILVCEKCKNQVGMIRHISDNSTIKKIRENSRPAKYIENSVVNDYGAAKRLTKVQVRALYIKKVFKPKFEIRFGSKLLYNEQLSLDNVKDVIKQRKNEVFLDVKKDNGGIYKKIAFTNLLQITVKGEKRSISFYVDERVAEICVVEVPGERSCFIRINLIDPEKTIQYGANIFLHIDSVAEQFNGDPADFSVMQGSFNIGKRPVRDAE